MAYITDITSMVPHQFVPEHNVSVLITNGITTHLMVSGDLTGVTVTSIKWYPADATSVLFAIKAFTQIDNTSGVFAIEILNNHLDITDRGGHVTIKLSDGSKFTKSVSTYGPPATGPLWQFPYCGLQTG